MKLFSTYDEKLQQFMQPFPAQTLGVAERSMQDEVNRKDSQLAAHPEDYSLYYIGDFNESDGFLSALQPVQLVCRASTLVKE